MKLDTLSLTFSALSDPTRRAILTRLGKGQCSVLELAQPFSISLPAISKHLKVLEAAGLITKSKSKQWRPCSLNAKPLKEAVDHMQQYEKFWDDRFDQLDSYLVELQLPKDKQ
ncbi:MAG: metalloregulator ArsR/SmtB family transcription factor [Armatimonadota bacterium]